MERRKASDYGYSLMRHNISHLQFPDHQLPHRGDVPAQVDRLRHPLHGGNRQRNFGNETLRQLKVILKALIWFQLKLFNVTAHWI